MDWNEAALSSSAQEAVEAAFLLLKAEWCEFVPLDISHLAHLISPSVDNKPHTPQLILGVKFQALVFAHKAQSDLYVISFWKKWTIK